VRVTVVYTPDAGNGECSDVELAAWISAAGHWARFVPRDDEEALSAALDDVGDLVAVAGGDGSVRSVGQRLLERRMRTPLAILPLGTANNIATCLHLPRDCETLIQGWAEARPFPFDVGRVETPWGSSLFFEGCGFGAVARSIAALTLVEPPPEEEGTKRELLRDLRVTREILADHPLHECAVTIDGREMDGRYAVVEIMNIATLGANLALAPDASPHDAWLDVVLVDERARLVLRDYLTSRLEGADVGDAGPDLPRHRARRVRVAWDGSRVHVDDQLQPSEEAAAAGVYWDGPMSLSIDVSLTPGVLTVLLPPASAGAR
jgi:diacylglycerol kinase (ATP)